MGVSYARRGRQAAHRKQGKSAEKLVNGERVERLVSGCRFFFFLFQFLVLPFSLHFALSSLLYVSLFLFFYMTCLFMP